MIGQLGLNSTHARINTEKGVAIDSIYVQDSLGLKVEDAKTLAALKKGLDTLVFGPRAA